MEPVSVAATMGSTSLEVVVPRLLLAPMIVLRVERELHFLPKLALVPSSWGR